MGLEVSRIFALAEGNFHMRNTKKATLGTSSKMSQNRTLGRRDESQEAWKSVQNVTFIILTQLLLLLLFELVSHCSYKDT